MTATLCKNCNHPVEEYEFEPHTIVYDVLNRPHEITSWSKQKILMHVGMVQVCQAGIECQCREATL